MKVAAVVVSWNSLDLLVRSLAALAALRLRRPVRLQLDRPDDMRLTGKRHPYSADYRLGLDAQGNFLAYEAMLYQNAGCTADLSTAILERSLFHATNAYRLFNGSPEGRAGLTVDRYGDLLLIQTFHDTLDGHDRSEIENFYAAALPGLSAVYNDRSRANSRISNPLPAEILAEANKPREFHEMGLRYVVQGRHHGQDPWLFLDMRAGRRRIMQEAAGKWAFTVLSLASGFKGGEVTPLFAIGATLGNTLAPLLALPAPLLAGIGLVAVFAGAANTPLACTLMAMELFGSGVGVYAALACAASYACSGHHGIYRAQRVDAPKHRPVL